MSHPFPRGIAGRRALGSILLGIILMLGGIATFAYAFFPVAVRAAIGMFPTDVLRTAEQVDARVWPGIAGVLLVGLGALVALRSRGYRALVPRPHKSNTVVYFDFENQSVSLPFVENFVRYVHEHLPDAHPDLFFFVDLANTGQSALHEVYSALRTRGFSLVDVPHRKPDDGRRPSKNIKNLVDMTLAIKALERALTAEEPQHFVIIAEDLIYLPLIHRLRTLGHEVSLWSREVSDVYKRFALNAGVDFQAFGNQFSKSSLPVVRNDEIEDEE